MLAAALAATGITLQATRVGRSAAGDLPGQARLRVVSAERPLGHGELGLDPPAGVGGHTLHGVQPPLPNEPDLLRADEPTGSLDERSVDLVLDLFARLRAQRPGMTMIIVTHDIRVAGTADHIIWLRDGRVTTLTGPSDPAEAGMPGVRRGFARRAADLLSYRVTCPALAAGVVSKPRAMDARWRLIPPLTSITTSEKGKAPDDLSTARSIGTDESLSSRIRP